MKSDNIAVTMKYNMWATSPLCNKLLKYVNRGKSWWMVRKPVTYLVTAEHHKMIQYKMNSNRESGS